MKMLDDKKNSSKKIERIIKNTTEANTDKIDWSKTWALKYPVLGRYQKEINVLRYAEGLRKMLDDLQMEYNYSELDAMLVLKDILYHEWKDNKNNK